MDLDDWPTGVALGQQLAVYGNQSPHGPLYYPLRTHLYRRIARLPQRLGFHTL
jgi:hypothetical protein